MLSLILAPIFVFAVIVIIHESGHFLLAKATGMKVDEFAVGFGPKICSCRKGETEYSLRLIPLGGYNKIAGMGEDENTDERAFSQKPVWARLIVILAGSIFNVLLAFFIFVGIFAVNGVYSFNHEPMVGSTIEGSSAHDAGLAAGDKIISINGEKVEKWEDISRLTSDKIGRVLLLTYERNKEIATVTVIPQDNGQGRAIVGITPKLTETPVSFPDALVMGFDRCVFIMEQIYEGMAGLVRGEGTGDVAGPIGVARMAGMVADSGMVSLLAFIALLSLNLGFLNLLPIPLLDGGVFWLTVMEGIYGKALPHRALIVIQSVGIVFLLVLFLLAMKNDITAIYK